MREYSNRIQVHLRKEDLELLNRRVESSGISRGAFVRQLIHENVPQDIPPPDYYGMMNELYGIRSALEQIAYSARTHGVDESSYNEACLKLDSCIRDIADAVRVPKHI